MAAVTFQGVSRAPLNVNVKRACAALAIAMGVALGAAAASGVPIKFVIAGAIAPFLLGLVLARPHLAAIAYVVAIYTDLLSLLVQYQGMPPLARFVGLALLSAVLGYKLVVRRERLVNDPAMTKWMLAYAFSVALGLIYARAPDLVMGDIIEFVRNFILYLIVLNTLTTAKRLRTALWLTLGMGVLLALLTVYQSVTHRFDDNFSGLAQYRISEISGGSDAPRPSGPVSDPNYYGQLLLIVLPLGLYLLFEGRTLLVRLLGLFSCAVLAVALVFTYSRGDALALVFLIGAAAIYKRPPLAYWIAGILGLFILVPLLPQNYVSRLSTIVDVAQGNQQAVLEEFSIRGRIGAIDAAVSMFLDHPLLGVGRENYPLYQAQYLAGTQLAFQSKGIPPHDLYLEVAAETGIVGLVVFAGLLAATARALWQARRLFLWIGDRPQAELTSWLGIGLMAYLVSSLFLHGAFLYMLWLQIIMIATLRQVARAEVGSRVRE